MSGIPVPVVRRRSTEHEAALERAAGTPDLCVRRYAEVASQELDGLAMRELQDFTF